MITRTIVLCLFASCQAFAFGQQIEGNILAFEGRSWTTKQGQVHQGKLLDVENGVIRISQPEGKFMSLELSTLSVADQAYCVWLKKRVDGSLQDLLDDGMKNDVNNSIRFHAEINNFLKQFCTEIRNIHTSQKTSLAKKEAAELAMKELFAKFEKIGKKPTITHLEVIDAKDLESRSGIHVNCKLLDSDSPHLSTLTGVSKSRFASELKPSDIIQIRFTIAPNPKATMLLNVSVPIDLDREEQYSIPSTMLQKDFVRQGNFELKFYVTSVQTLTREDKAYYDASR